MNTLTFMACVPALAAVFALGCVSEPKEETSGAQGQHGDVKSDQVKPSIDKQGNDKPGVDAQAGVEPASVESIDDKPQGDEPKLDEPKSDEPKSDEPKSDEPSDVKTRNDEPRAEKPGAAEPIDEKPDEQLSEEESVPRNKFDDRLDNAFPPTLSDVKYHRSGWFKNDCLRCHETGVGDAPIVKHANMSPILLDAKCRSCHVRIPGSKPAIPLKKEGEFPSDAFPPMTPASSLHVKAWTIKDCLLCHEDGTKDAPILVHKGLPKRLKTAKCRTCHVQVRAVDMDKNIK